MKKIFSAILLATILTILTVGLAFAQAPTPAPPVSTPPPAPVSTPSVSISQTPVNPLAIDYLIQLFFGLVVTVPGFSALGVFIVNALKIPGWVQDGNAGVVQNLLAVVFAVVIGCLVLFFPSVSVPKLNLTFGQLAAVLTTLLPTFAILYSWLAPKLHAAIRGFPIIGYSHSVKPTFGVMKS